MALKRNSNGVREQVSAHDDSISRWHRTLPRKCYMTDIDALEFRADENGNLIPKLIIEFKAAHTMSDAYALSASVRAQFELARLAGVPFVVAWYAIDQEIKPTKFFVWNVTRSGFCLDWRRHVRAYSVDEFQAELEKL